MNHCNEGSVEKTQKRGKMQEIEIEIPYLPKSLNQIIRMKRILIYIYYKGCERDVFWLVKAKKDRPKEPFKKAKMIITFVFPDNKARDFDNFIGGSKGFIDGIKKAGLIEDDKWQKLELEFRGIIGKKPKTLINLKEIKQNGSEEIERHPF